MNQRDVASNSALLKKFLSTPATKEKLAAASLEPFDNSPQKLQALIRDDYSKYGKVITSAGIKIE